MLKSIEFVSLAAVRDLHLLLQRLQQAQVDRVQLQLVRRGAQAQAVFAAALLAPLSLLDDTPTVLAEKAYPVLFPMLSEPQLSTVGEDAAQHSATAAQHSATAAQHSATAAQHSAVWQGVDRPAAGQLATELLHTVFALPALLERTTRMVRLEQLVLQLPPQRTTASWAGVSAPLSGWQRLGEVTAASLAQVASAGSAQVAAVLPAQPGAALVQQVRARVWAQQMLPQLPKAPAGIAFALQQMGFLEQQSLATVWQHRGWVRFVTAAGSVVARQGV